MLAAVGGQGAGQGGAELGGAAQANAGVGGAMQGVCPIQEGALHRSAVVGWQAFVRWPSLRVCRWWRSTAAGRPLSRWGESCSRWALVSMLMFRFACVAGAWPARTGGLKCLHCAKVTLKPSMLLCAQAFFESYDAANAAFEAARQSGGLA